MNLPIFEHNLLEKKKNGKDGGESNVNYNQLTLDAFQVISDWYHYAILELISIKGFQPNSKWIAPKLGITVSEVNIAVERLQRLGLLKICDDGKWINGSGSNTTTGNAYSATAFRRLQRDVLKMALNALEEVPMEVRDQTSMTMAIDSSQLPEARIRIKKFRRNLCQFLQESGPRDQVYQLGISLYPITRNNS